ncbi:MAG: hypothetical protein VKJ09_15750, partial [Leptolyngbya sp.]|nr:hypothetical protein [Leptolyngbya sp.]
SVDVRGLAPTHDSARRGKPLRWLMGPLLVIEQCELREQHDFEYRCSNFFHLLGRAGPFEEKKGSVDFDRLNVIDIVGLDNRVARMLRQMQPEDFVIGGHAWLSRVLDIMDARALMDLKLKTPAE